VSETIEAHEAASTPPTARDEKAVLRASIERSEAELRDAVEELTTAVKNDITAVKNDITLGSHIVEHPTMWLAGGFVAGVLLAWRR
jgi:hypothetical protein